MKESKKNKFSINQFEIINFLRKHLQTIILIISLLLFTLLSYLTFNNKINTLDANVHTYVIGIRNNPLTRILLIITSLSSPQYLVILSIILLITIKNKKIPLLISLNLICSFLTNQTAKFLFSRTRPIGINLIEESGFSYPSGHSMVSMAYYGFITYLIYQKLTNKYAKIALLIALILITLTIGFSRIYLGVHYLSDVIGGYLLSIIYLMILLKISNPNKITK